MLFAVFSDGLCNAIRSKTTHRLCLSKKHIQITCQMFHLYLQ